MEYRNCYMYLSNDGEKVYIDSEEAEKSFVLSLRQIEVDVEADPPFEDEFDIETPRNYRLVYVKDLATGDKFYTFENEVFEDVI